MDHCSHRSIGCVHGSVGYFDCQCGAPAHAGESQRDPGHDQLGADELYRRYGDRLAREVELRTVSLATRHPGQHGLHDVEQWVSYGASPRASLGLIAAGRAMALLRRGDVSVTDVCFAVGCASLGTFSTRFAELVGMSPSQYRHASADATQPKS